MRTARSYIQIGIGSLFALLFIFFVYHQTRGLLIAASIDISSPQNGALLHESILTVTGVAKKIAFISINGRQIFTDEHGAFKESLLLSPGYTIITVSAEDAFKRKIEKQLQVIYLESASGTEKTFTETIDDIEIATTTTEQRE